MTPSGRADRLGIGMLSVFGLPPIELVDLAAKLGCRHISVAMQGMPLVPLGYAPFSLKDDAGLRSDLLAGEGELPLHDLLAALPADTMLEIEVPRRSLALAGVSPLDRLRPCVEATRRLLSEVQAGWRSGRPAAR